MSELITDGAYGTGLSTVTPDGTVLDVWYPSPALFSSDAPYREQPELRLTERTDDIRGVQLRIVQGRIASLADAPVDTADAYLRLHLLSARLVRPRSINLDGIFGLLPNNAWTSLGPVPADDVERVRLEAVRNNLLRLWSRS
jgi:2,3,4,5-tetrahydropyridine-2-carboxylate N-succinyltransferase